VLTAALLGWMFDGFEQGLFSLVGQPAVADLLGPARAADAGRWFGVIMAVFLVGAAAGGVLFGWLGDRIGRVPRDVAQHPHVPLVTGLCGFAQTPLQLAVLRFVASLGIGGEWALGVALVVEVWPGQEPRLHGRPDRGRRQRRLPPGRPDWPGDRLVHAGHRATPAVAGPVGRRDGLAALRGGRGPGLAAADDRRRAAGPADLLHPPVRPGVGPVGARAAPRRHLPLGHARPAGRAGREPRGRIVISCGRPAAAAWARRPTRRGARGRASRRHDGRHPGRAARVLVPGAALLQRAVGAGSLPAGSTGPTVRRMLLGASLAGVALLGTWGSLSGRRAGRWR
jgi:hypothetical protein